MRTLRTIGIVGGATALLFSATVAFAQNKPMIARQDGRESENRIADMRRDNASTTATTTRGEIKKDAHERMQTARADAQTRIKAQREKAEHRLADIKDKTKQQKAEHLAKQFENINSKWTEHFMKRLDRLDAIVQKIQNRSNIAAGNGKDVAAATTAIASAKTAIATARTAVVAQAAKTYVLDPSAVPVTTATTTPSGQKEFMKDLRTAFKNLHTTLFKDLFALRDGPMTDARKAVHSALQTLSNIRGINNGTATSTATSTNQ